MAKLSSRIVRKIVRILKTHGVRKASLFGLAARSEMSEDSEIDLLVEFKGKTGILDLCGIELELEKATCREVDLLTYRSPHPLIRDRVLGSEARII